MSVIADLVRIRRTYTTSSAFLADRTFVTAGHAALIGIAIAGFTLALPAGAIGAAFFVGAVAATGRYALSRTAMRAFTSDAAVAMQRRSDEGQATADSLTSYAKELTTRAGLKQRWAHVTLTPEMDASGGTNPSKRRLTSMAVLGYKDRAVMYVPTDDIKAHDITTLRAIAAHETAHVIRRDSANRALESAWRGLRWGVLVAPFVMPLPLAIPAILVTLVATGFAQKLVQAALSRHAEREADVLGARLAGGSEVYNNAFDKYIRTFSKRYTERFPGAVPARRSALSNLLASHPAPGEREKLVRLRLAKDDGLHPFAVPADGSPPKEPKRGFFGPRYAAAPAGPALA